MRAQLAVPGNTLLLPQTYNAVFTLHGTTMIVLAVTPTLFGFSKYLLPLQTGACEVAFPRLNAFSLWITVFGGLLMYLRLFEGAPTAGRFRYAILSERPFSMSLGQDFWAVSLMLVEVGSCLTALNLLVTTLRYRAPAWNCASCRCSPGWCSSTRSSSCSPFRRSMPRC